MTLRWPHGRYNGQRIGGFELRMRVNLLSWYFRLPNRVHPEISIGPVRIYLWAAYE